MADNKPKEEASMGEALGVASPEKMGEMESAEEYELTVTEDSLLRLHGLSLTLPLPCDLCPIGTVFDDLDEFDAHMNEHPEAKMFACQLCSNTYKSWSNLVAHRKMFHFGEVLSCEKCGTRRSHARLEGSVHYPVGNKPHGCEECEVGLDTISDVYRHYFFHKAPPGGRKRPGGVGLAEKKKSAAAEENSDVQGQSGRKRQSTPQNLSGASVSKISGNRTANLQSGNLIGNLVVSPSSGPHGKLILCPSAAVPGGTVVGNLPGIQNGNLIGNVIAIPAGNLIGGLPGIQCESLIMKPAAGIQDGIVRGNSHGIQSRSLAMKPAGIQVGEMTINPIEAKSDNSNISPSGHPSKATPGNLSSAQSRINTGSATVIQGHNSVITPTSCEILNRNLPGNQSDKQNSTPPEIPSENKDLAEESKSSLAKGDTKSQTVKQSGGLRPIAPKGSSSVPESEPISVPVEQSEESKYHKHFCPHCTFSCGKLEEYRNHLISFARGHNCIMCSGSHFKRMSLTDHEYCQSQTQQFNCIPCTTILESEEECNAHLKEHHTAGYLPCCLCGRKFNWLVYIEHIKSCKHKRIEWEFRRQLTCKTCEPCGKLFHSAGALRRHMKRHDINRKLLHDCKVCGRTFQHGGAYAKHLWANPTHGPPEQRAKIPGMTTNYICEKCGKTFSKHEGLKGHLMRHAGVRPYACTSCPKSFITRTSLVVHVRQHTGERPYMCEICGKNFTGPTSLYVHQRKHRSDDGRGASVVRAAKVIKKPGTKHTCPVCGKTLSSKLIFEGHIRQHTGERPFVCKVCGRGFTTSKIMKLHTKRHKKDGAIEKVQEVRWVHDISSVPSKAVVDIEGGFDSNSSNTCIFLCPQCGLGLVSPDELEEHLSKGDCPSGGAEMFVLPMTNESECIDTGSMVDVD